MHRHIHLSVTKEHAIRTILEMMVVEYADKVEDKFENANIKWEDATYVDANSNILWDKIDLI